MAEKTRVEVMRGAFESKYGAPTNDNKKVLIGMKGGKAVYGDELDAVDTTGAQYVGTYSKNQAISNDMAKEMARSGGMYNPSSNNIRLEGTPAPTENDYKTTIRASDGQVMVGALSPDAAAMREKTTADNRFASTLDRLNARPDRTSLGAAGKPEVKTPPPLDLRRIAEGDRARESSPFTKGPAPLGGGSNVLLAGDSSKQAGNDTFEEGWETTPIGGIPTKTQITPLSLDGGDPTVAELLKQLRRRANQGTTVEVVSESSTGAWSKQ